MSPGRGLPVVLFGYEASAFTTKVRMALKMKQVPYSFVTVPAMMPRPILKKNFNLTYRKIPALAIGKDIYVDTSLILEALESQFPTSAGYGTIYPPASNGRAYRSLARGFASYWIDRPFFRIMTGLVPADVWRTSFGVDRAQLIGHKLDPDKLEKKLPRNMSSMDLHLSILEPLLESADDTYPWLFDTKTPSTADIAFFYQLDWGYKISQGQGVYDLTSSELRDWSGEGAKKVFNEQRYPSVWRWYERMKQHLESLKTVEEKVDRSDEKGVNVVLERLRDCEVQSDVPMLSTPASQHEELDHQSGLVNGAKISITPDDTGRDDPTIGSLVALSPEEVVIVPDNIDGRSPAVGNVRIHFPRIAFVVKPLKGEQHVRSKI